MYVPILRSIGTKLTNLENMQRSMFYLTSRDAKTVRRTSWRLGDIFQPTRSLYDFRFKKYGSNSNVFDYLDLCSIGCHTSRHEVLESGNIHTNHNNHIHKNGTPYVITAVTLLIDIRNIFHQARSPVQKLWLKLTKCVFFNVFGDLDLWPIFWFETHKVRMKYWSLIAKFHKNPSSIKPQSDERLRLPTTCDYLRPAVIVGSRSDFYHNRTTHTTIALRQVFNDRSILESKSYASRRLLHDHRTTIVR